jgi:hypothetical protein
LFHAEAIVSPRKTWEILFLDFFLHAADSSTAAMVVIDGLDEAPAKTIKHFVPTSWLPYRSSAEITLLFMCAVWATRSRGVY